MGKKVYERDPKWDRAIAEGKRAALQENMVTSKSVFGTHSSQFTATPIDFNAMGYGKAAKGEHRKGGLWGLVTPGKDYTRPWDQYTMPEDMAYKAFKEQTVTDLAYDATIGGMKNFAAGFIDNAASWDLTELSDWQAKKGFDKTGNWLQQIAGDIKHNMQKENQIYQNGDDMWTAAYWANQAQSFGYTAGIMGEMLAEQAVLALTTGGSGNILGLANKGGLVKNLVTQGVYGIAGGIREGYMNARETGEQTYEELKRKGFSEEQALKYAGEAAFTGFKTEVGPLVVLNTLQNIALFGGTGKLKLANAFNRAESKGLSLGFSDFAEQGIEKILPNVTNKWGKRALKYGVATPASESMEEVVQDLAGQYGKHTAMQDAMGTDNEFNIDTISLRDSAIGGYFGGMLLGAGAKAVNKLRGYAQNKRLENELQEFMEEAANATNTNFQNSEKASTEMVEAFRKVKTDPSDVNKKIFEEKLSNFRKSQNKSQLDNVVKALQYDYMKGSGNTAYDMIISNMQEQLKAVNNNDVKALQEMGLVNQKGEEKVEGSLEYIKNNFGTHIENANFVKNTLNDILLNKTSDFGAAIDILEHEYNRNINQKELTKLNSAKDALYSSDNYYNQLSSEAKKRYRLENELYALEQTEKNNPNFSELNKERLQEIREELSNTEKYKSSDKQILMNINKRKGYIDAHLSEIEKQHEINDNIKNIEEQSKEAVIREKTVKKAKEKVKKAKTKEQVAEVVEEAVNTLPKKEADEIATIAKQKESEIASGVEAVKPEPVKEGVKPHTEASEKVDGALRSFGEYAEDISEVEMANATFSRENTVKDFTQDQLEAFNNYFEEIKADNKLDTLSFKDVVKDYIERTSFDKARKNFNGLLKAWKDTGRNFDTDPNMVYNSFFNSFNIVDSALDTNVVEVNTSPGTASEVTDKAQKKVNQISSGVANFDPNQNTYEMEESFDLEDGRTHNPDLKFAYNFSNFRRISAMEWERIGRGLKAFPEGDVVNNHYILDKEFLQYLQKEEPNSLVARSLDIDDIPYGDKTWGELKKENKSKLNPAEYITWFNKNVPIGIAYEGKLSNNEPVYLAMAHTEAWYSPRNISDRKGVAYQEDMIKQGKANIAAFRKEVLSADNTTGVTVNISKKPGFGSIDKLDPNTKPVSINEATGDTTMALFHFNESSREFKFMVGTKEFDKGTVLGAEYLIEKLEEADTSQKFFVVHINQVDIDEAGNPVYMAFPAMLNSPIEEGTLKGNLDSKIVNNAKYSMLAAMVLNNMDNKYFLDKIESLYNFTVKDAEAIQKVIADDLNIDIVSGLKDYLQVFVNTKAPSTEDLSTFKFREHLSKDSIKSGLTYFFGHSNNNAIEVGQKDKPTFQIGGKIINNSNGNKTDEEVANIHLGNFHRLFNEDTGIFKASKLNFNSKLISSSRFNTITYFDSKGVPTDDKVSYENLVKNNFKTNVLSHEIETITGEKKWVTDVQPMIYFSTKTSGTTTTAPTTVEEKAQSAAQQAEEQIEEREDAKETFAKLEAELKAKGATEKQIELARAAFNAKNNIFESRVNFSSKNLAGQNTNKISALTDNEQRELVNAIKHSIISDLDFTGNIQEQILNGIENGVRSYIEPLLAEQKQMLELWKTIPNSTDMEQQTSLIINKLEAILNEESKLNNRTVTKDTPLGVLITEFNSLLSTNFEEDSVEDIDQEENFSRSFLEKDIKLSFSAQLRLSLFGLKEKNKGNQVKINNLGIERYNSADEIYLRLADITTSIPSSWSMLMTALDKKAEDTHNPLYKDLKTKLEALPKHVQNELLHKTISKKFTAYKVLNSPQKPVAVKNGDEVMQVTPGYNISLLEEGMSDNKTMERAISKAFVNSSDFGIRSEDNEIVLNKVYAEQTLKELRDALKAKDKNPKKLKALFNKLNLGDISENSIDYYATTFGDKIFEKGSLLQTIEFNLSRLVAKPGNVVLEDNNFFDNIGTQLKEIIGIEVMLNGSSVSASVRVNDKTLQGVIANTSLHDLNQALASANNKDLIKKYQNVPQNMYNLVLEVLLSSEKFRKSFSNIGFSSPEVYKFHGKRNFGEGDIDKIALQDILATKLGLYTNEKGNLQLEPEVAQELENKTGLNFRIGQMTSHTLSDKGRVMFLTNLLIQFKGTEIAFNEEGSIALNGSLNTYLLDQVFNSEIERIKQSYAQKSNFTAQELASKVFHYIPSMNSITATIRGVENVSIHDYLHDRLSAGEVLEADVMEEFKQAAASKISDYINSEVDNKISKDGTTGELVELGFYDNSPERKAANLPPYINLDDAYMKKNARPDHLQNIRFKMTEYVVNNLIHNMNTHALYLGDISFYSKDKLIPTSNLVSESGAVYGKRIDSVKISKPEVYVKMAQEIGAALDKRTASLIAPGFKLANSENPLSGVPQNFLHVAVQDVESMSSVMRELLEMEYGKFDENLESQWNTLQKNITTINSSNDPEQINLLSKENRAIVENYFSNIEDYFNITGTDAQEYTTWRTHLDMLFRQGSKITEDQYNSLLHKLSNNIALNEEEKNIFFQPVKPVYTNLVYDSATNMMRPVYIKSSAFPLLPQLTKNLKIDEVRKKLESMEGYNKDTKQFTPVRLSYQTANKIGSLKTNLTMDMLYNEAPITPEVLTSAVSTLPFSGFKIQQENPSKEEKFFHKGKDAYISMGSQFMKVILGNFVNKEERQIFPNLFSKDVLEMAGVTTSKEGNLSGQDLDKIYNAVYFKYSDLLRQGIEAELGLGDVPFSQMTLSKRNSMLEKLQSIIKKEVVERGYPDYLSKTVEFIDKEAAHLEMVNPLFFDVNTHKFEALLQSLIASRLITHKLPGNGHIVGSSEGFTRKASLEELSDLDKQGIVWINGYQEELTPTYITDKDGNRVLVKSQVLIKSHYKYTDAEGNYKYVDLANTDPSKGPVYSEDIVEDGKVVGKKLNLDMIEPELLSQFSFRIPTSSHQSGTIIEVAGFLPTSMQDLVIVPKEHTTQLGEDYDIDKRYVYKSNYYLDSNGKITKLQYDANIKTYVEQVNNILNETDVTADKLLSVLFNVDILDEAQEIKQELLALGLKEDKEGLIQAGRNALNKVELKMLENSLIDVYKSVYLTTDSKIQRSIFKPLVTKTAEDTAKAMDGLLQSSTINPNFSAMSDTYQTELIKIGADGKGGIGVHSNAVTLEAQMQRLGREDKIHLGSIVRNPNTGEIVDWKPFTITIGQQPFFSILGVAEKTIEGSRDIAEQHGENQNVSTDNINKQIMGKRNENSYTMGVYALLAHMGFDLTSNTIDMGGKREKLHIPSLVINQPILREYVRLMEKYNSITADFISNEKKEQEIVKELGLKFGFISPSEITDDFVYVAPDNSSLEIVSEQDLWDNLKEEQALKHPNIQEAVLNDFLKLDKEAKKLSKMQQLFNISTSKLGVSYFETIQRINTLEEIGLEALEIADSDIAGTSYHNFDKFIGTPSYTPQPGYTKVGTLYWKPTTIEGKMLINSLSVAERLMPTFFPYDSPMLKTMVADIFSVQQKDPYEKSASNMKWKYEIMSSFKDFVASNTGVSTGSLEQERQRLFFDSNVTGNMSLGSILKDLNKKGHPIMSNKLLKELEVNKDLRNGLVTILHTTNDNTTLDKATKYDALLDLLKDDTVLGTYNNEELTVSKLAQDLVTYSFLTDNQNGATGFKNFVNIEYLNVIGVNNAYRNIYSMVSSRNFDAEARGLLNRFERQYFQHHPERASTVSEFEKNSLQKALFNEPSKFFPQYISVRKRSDKNNRTTTKEYTLYELNEDRTAYKEIPVLGTTAYNEYDASKNTQYSLINKVDDKVFFRNGKKYVKVPIKGKDTAVDLDSYQRTFESESWNNVEKILQNFLNSPFTSNEYKNFINQLLPYINKDVEVRWVANGSNAYFEDNGKPVIQLNSRIYQTLMDKYNNDFDKTQQKFREVVFEEILHSITVRELTQYMEYFNPETGDFKLREDAPLFVTKIARAYDIAREAVPYDPNDTSTYYSKNIFEFVAGMYVAEDYRQRLEDSETGFVSRFLEAIRDMLKYIHSQITGKEIDYKDEIFSAVNELLEVNSNKFGNKGVVIEEFAEVVEEIKEEDTAATVPTTPTPPVRPLDKVRNLEGPYQIDQFSYSFDIETGEVIHHHKTKGDIVETNPKQINKVLVAFAKDNFYTYKEFNGNKYVRIMGKVLNMDNENEVTQKQILDLFETKTENPTSEAKPATNNGPIVLNPDQVKAFDEIMEFIKSPSRKTHSLIGYAGTGKTTLINFIKEAVDRMGPFDEVIFTSPTHRANSVIKLKNPSAKVLTLHQLLGLSIEQDLEKFDARDAKFVPQSDVKVGSGDLVIIDESSMINDDLFAMINQVMNNVGAKILYIGDDAQIKPVKQVHKSKALTSTEKISRLTIVQRANNQALLDESMHLRNNKDFTYKSDMTDNKGVQFTNNRKEFLTKVFEMFTSEEFKNNPLLARVLSGTNAEVQEVNRVLREAIHGKNVEEFTEGDILMGYNNWRVDYTTKQPVLNNGGDYVVTSATKSTKRIGEVLVEGYDLNIKNLLNKNSKEFQAFAISKNTPASDIDSIGATYEKMRLRAISLTGRDRAAAFRALSEFKDSFISPVDITYKGTTKIGKTIDYGYAHTVHKSQGGTYKYSFVLADTINKFPDPELKAQLKYVATTRAEEGAFILTSHKITEAEAKKEEVENTLTWARKSENSYEVSSKGDTRFSALNATLKDGRTIEEAYQLDIKGYRSQGNNWKLGKGKSPIIPFYNGNITPNSDTIFVFGSNPEGRHGAGAAKIAKDKFGAIYGQGEGLQGNAYALPTKDLRIKENNGYKSILPNQIIQSIKKLYEVAKQNPTKKFKIAYRNTTEKSLNGYTGLEMIDMFNSAGERPSNIVFSKEWVDTKKINPISKEQSWNGYKNLWRTYLNENPDLEQDLIKKSKGKVLTDMFASTDVSQARALAELLNERKSTSSTPSNPSEFTNHSGGAQDTPTPKMSLSEALSLGIAGQSDGYMESRENESFRLPEIKKCK